MKTRIYGKVVSDNRRNVFVIGKVFCKYYERNRYVGNENGYKILTEIAKVFKALSDPKRVKIVDLLSCGEMCGCVLLKCFEVTQPTLAHDMKVLTEAGIVTSRRNGKKTMYSLNLQLLETISTRLKDMLAQEPEKKPRGKAKE